jgi:HK97 family phage prohead protease
MEKEIRIVPDDDSEVRALKDSRKIEGYGIVFNKESRDLGGFQEIILPEAIDGVLEKSDVLALLNHDISKGVLARSDKGKGTMELIADKKGVKYNFDAPSFDLGDQLLEGVKRGDIKESSFAFTVAEEEWNFKRKPTALRTIKKFDMIYDMSPCYRAAYADTTVAARSLEEIRKKEEQNILEEELRIKTELETKAKAEEPVIDPIEWYRSRPRYF